MRALHPIEPEQLTRGNHTEITTKMSHSSTVSLWGSRSPHIIKRDPRLWSLILEITKRNREGIEHILSTQKPSKPQPAADDSVLSLLRLSDLLPDHPILYALQRAAVVPPIEVSYLETLIRHRDEVGQMTPHADSDADIEQYAAGLNKSLSALTAFAMRPDNTDAPSMAAPAA
jgi:hypothetical protein